MPLQSFRVSSFADHDGDKDAPVGSRLWAIWFLNRAKARRKDLESDAEALAGILTELETGKAWEPLGLMSFGQLCSVEIGLSDEQVDAIKHAKPGTAVGAALTASQKTMAEAKPAGPKEGGRPSGKPSDALSLPTGSTSSARLAARIKRDRPDIAARVEKGEFKSMRAAGIEAGIVKVKTALDQLKSAWKKATADERKAFLDSVL